MFFHTIEANVFMRALQRSSRASCHSTRRRAVVLVEFALVISVFAMFFAAIVEFGYAYLVINSMNAAARSGARLGCMEDKTNQDIQNEVQRILHASFDDTQAVVRIKDASVFDSGNVNAGSINYSSLPDCEVSSLEAGDMFVVQVEVNYSNVAIMPPLWTQALVLRRQSVVRHE
ncbi:MAG: TadE/TadG family type IV pilus assembly protein [Planctomycetaceae bacterium]